MDTISKILQVIFGIKDIIDSKGMALLDPQNALTGNISK